MKSRILTAVLVCVALLSGCSNGKVDLSKATDTTVGINRDGTIEELVVEDFDKEYYSLEDLMAYVDQEVAEFNEKHPLEIADEKNGESITAVTVQSIEKNEQDQMIHMTLGYDSVDTYDIFNDCNIVYGTLEELLSGGTISGEQMLVTVKKQETVAAGDIADAGKMHVVMTESAMHLQTADKIVYYSEGVELTGKNEVQTTDEQAIIIFK